MMMRLVFFAAALFCASCSTSPFVQKVSRDEDVVGSQLKRSSEVALDAYRDALIREAARLEPSGSAPADIAVAARAACPKELFELESANRKYVYWIYRKVKTVNPERKAGDLFERLKCIGDEVVINLVVETRVLNNRNGRQ